VYDDALAAYGVALNVAETNPEKLGMGFLAARARLGLATAFNALRMQRDETRELAAAEQLIEQKAAYDFGWFAEVCDGLAAIDFARFHSRAGLHSEAIAYLGRAAASGWNDKQSLEIDQCFVGYAGIPEFDALREELGARSSVFQKSLARSAIDEHPAN
jgi:hypothetical protein